MTPGPDLETRSTVRQLTLRGLAPSDALNVTALMCGIPVADRHWQLREINQMLFLRALRRQGRFGPDDGSGRIAGQSAASSGRVAR